MSSAAVRLGRWLSAHEVERTGRNTPGRALVKLVLVYLLGFGLGIFSAILYLSSARDRALSHTATGWGLPEIIGDAMSLTAALLAILVVSREAPTWARPTPPGGRWWTELKAFGLGWAACLAGGVATSLLHSPSYPRSHAAASAWPSVVGSLLAGPVEETVVLVMPLVLLRAARWRWWQVILAGLVLRLAYHVYYGWPAIGLTVWALAMILIYLRTHAVIGLILAHSYWDMTSTVGVYWSNALGGLMVTIPLFSVIIWGIVSLILWAVRRRRRAPAALVTAPAATASAAAAPAPAPSAAVARPAGWYQNAEGYWWWWDGRSWLASPQSAEES